MVAVVEVVAVVVVVVMVEGWPLLVVRAGRNGGQGAVLGNVVRTHATLGPGDTLGSLSVLPSGAKAKR